MTTTDDEVTGQMTAPREIGPERFQRLPTDPQERHLGRALLAGFALLALLVGIPLGLWLAGDGPPPIPTSLPTRDDITGTIGAEQVVGVLVWIAWLAWLQFAVCTMVEIASAIRGVGLPRRVPLAGPSQRFARVLVGSIMLATTAVGQASAAVPAEAPSAPSSHSVVAVAEQVAQHAVSQSGEIRGEHDTAADRSAATQDADVRYMLGDMELDPEEGAALDRLIFHTTFALGPHRPHAF